VATVIRFAADPIGKGYAMISSLVGLLFMLIGLSFIATGLSGENSLIESGGLRAYGTYIGAAFFIAGFVIGKFWSLKVKTKYTYPPTYLDSSSKVTVPEGHEKVEEQFNLFDEPRSDVTKAAEKLDAPKA
jgi:hypothetical protein